MSLYFGAGTAQLLSYAIALLIMVLGIRKVAAMNPTETNLFFGIVLVMILSLQTVITGTIVGLGEKRS